MLRRRALSDGSEWKGFRPVAYNLDPDRVGKLRIDIDATRFDSGGESSPSTTLAEALAQLRGEGVQEIATETGHLTVKTRAGDHSFGGASF